MSRAQIHDLQKKRRRRATARRRQRRQADAIIRNALLIEKLAKAALDLRHSSAPSCSEAVSASIDRQVARLEARADVLLKLFQAQSYGDARLD